MSLSPNALNVGINGIGSASLVTLAGLAIFRDYAVEWTVACSIIGAIALVSNSVVNKRRGDRELELKEQAAGRQVEAHNKLMGRRDERTNYGPDKD